jgi:hypothetical protein
MSRCKRCGAPLIATAAGEVSAELLRAVIALTHPDRHPAERTRAANRVTQQLLELLNRTTTPKRKRKAA